MLGCVGVVGMHLHGEVVARVQDLDQQRKAVALSAGKELVVVVPEVGEGVARPGALRDGAVSIGMGAYGPALANGAVGNLVAEVSLELATSPDLLVEDGNGKDEVELVVWHVPS